MGKKKKKQSVEEQATTPVAAKAKKNKPAAVVGNRGINYPDPCFHCRNMEMSSQGFSCKEESEAFWNDPQGFEVNPKTGIPTTPCLKFSHLPKPLKPSMV